MKSAAQPDVRNSDAVNTTSSAISTVESIDCGNVWKWPWPATCSRSSSHDEFRITSSRADVAVAAVTLDNAWPSAVRTSRTSTSDLVGTSQPNTPIANTGCSADARVLEKA